MVAPRRVQRGPTGEPPPRGNGGSPESGGPESAGGGKRTGSRGPQSSGADPRTRPPLDSSTFRLRVLNALLADLNRTPDVREALGRVLEHLVRALGLRTGWIVLRDPAARGETFGAGFVMAAHYNLPPEMSLARRSVWDGTCRCEARHVSGEERGAYIETCCPRIEHLRPESGSPAVHASAALEDAGRVLGMLNVATADWGPLDEPALKFLEETGRDVGEALGRARVYERVVARRLNEQSALLELSQRLLEHGDPEAIMDTLVDRVRNLLDVDGCALVRPDPVDGSLRFRAAVGWRSDPVAARARIPAEEHCSVARAILTRQPVAVPDLVETAVSAQATPWVEGEAWRGHLAVPLVAKDRALGALVVNTREPRTFTEQEQGFVHLMANTAALALDRIRQQALERDRRRLEGEMETAHHIQSTLLPGPDLEVDGWAIATQYESARQVGGDFFDVIPLPGPTRRVALVIGDVSGKSVSGALLMALTLGAIRDALRRHDGPCAVLEAVNRRVVHEARSDRFVTVFYGVLDADTGRMQYASAGHNAPIHVRAALHTREEMPIQGPALGIFSNPEYVPFDAQFEPGDILVLYTDGITEALDDHFDMFGYERLFDAIEAGEGGGAVGVKDAVLRRVADFTAGAPPSDDVTLLVAQRLGDGRSP